MSYTLEPRQEVLYVETVTILRPVDSKAVTRTYEIVNTNVRCMFIGTDNFDDHIGATSIKKENIMTSDKWHFHSEEDVQDDDVIYAQSGVRVEPGRFYTVAGAPKKKNYRAMNRKVYSTPLVPHIKPEQITNGTLSPWPTP